MFGRKETKPHVPARVKAFGRARLEIAQRARSSEDWESLWKPPMQAFPFEWGPHWKQCIEYKVDDFTAEVGFLIDILGLPVNAFNPDYAMFTSPDQDFYFAVVAANTSERSTPADALRIQFMVADIFSLTETLQARGVQLDREPSPVTEGSAQWVASFRTPHGICMEIWGLVEMVPIETSLSPVPENRTDPVSIEAEEDESSPPSLSLLEDFAIFDEGKVEEEPDQGSASEEITDDEDDIYDFDEEDNEVDHETTPLPSNTNSPSWSYASKQMDAEPETSKETLTKRNGNDKPVRLLPRSAVEPHVNKQRSLDSTTFRPAPKTAQEKKPASIWDDVAHDVEYLDLDSPAETDPEPASDTTDKYHYKPIPLNREQ